MKDIVIHIREDVCAKNNRDPEAIKLIEVASQFGFVETLDQAIAKEREEHKNITANLTKQYEGMIAELTNELALIKEQKVTPEELEVLRAIRKKASVESVQYENAIKTRDEQLKAVIAEHENRVMQLKSLFKF